MVAQTHPFKPIEEKTLPWDGVHTPDRLRDDPDHPHSIFGEGHKNTFQDGGLIPDANVFGQPVAAATSSTVEQVNQSAAVARAAPGRVSRRPATTQAAPVVPPLPAPANPRARRTRRRFADGGKVANADKDFRAKNQKVAHFQGLSDGGKVKKKADRQTSATKDLTAKTAGTRLKGRALQIENAERAAEGKPPLKPPKDSKK